MAKLLLQRNFAVSVNLIRSFSDQPPTKTSQNPACKPAPPACGGGAGPGKGSSMNAKLLESLNKHLNAELQAQYAYAALYAYFQRPTVGLSGFERMNYLSMKEEARHAKSLISLINSRGGTAQFTEIAAPKQQEWKTPLEALKFAVEVEATSDKLFQEAVKTAMEVGDMHVAQTLQQEIGNDELKSLNILNKYIAQLEGGNNVYTVDQNLGQSVSNGKRN